MNVDASFRRSRERAGPGNGKEIRVKQWRGRWRSEFGRKYGFNPKTGHYWDADILEGR